MFIIFFRQRFVFYNFFFSIHGGGEPFLFRQNNFENPLTTCVFGHLRECSFFFHTNFSKRADPTPAGRFRQPGFARKRTRRLTVGPSAVKVEANTSVIARAHVRAVVRRPVRTHRRDVIYEREETVWPRAA